ncbi:tail fiber protein [Ferrimonas sp. YFM]|uniref:phage tail protein n=1 Tax=Ferrimonas sp. YFM TaxID=3028878 RepID=UPI002573DA43|nr:tail fiber protein [Ferrimonas sp. YFM]BDY05999.1 microcystin dependent MdpB family protein [Ferrimonas sp. YFM]
MDSFTGQIRIFAGTFAPVHFAFCSGTLLSISTNQALFSLLGTNFGGDGRTSFGLPEMRGRLPVGAGQGPGLGNYLLGQIGGWEDVTLTTAEIPSHNHPLVVSESNPSQTIAGPGSMLANGHFFQTPSSSGGGQYATMNEESVSSEGGGQAHENRMPSLGVNFIICLQGIYPSRN